MRKLWAIFLMLCLVVMGVNVPSSYAATDNTRIWGDTQFTTARAVAEEMYSGTVQAVILASGNGYADALSASVLAHKLNAPILLVDKTVASSNDAFDFIKNHLAKAGRVYLIGGNAVINDGFVTQLNSLGYPNITRIGGVDRYDTNMQIVNQLDVPEGTPIVVASGETYPDALSISSTAAHNGWPILLFRGDTMPWQVQDFLSSDKPEKVYIAGGPGVVSQAIENSLSLYTPKPEIFRLYGNDRYETCNQIDSKFSAKPSNLYLTSGENFADALAGSVLAAQDGSPLVLVNPTLANLPSPIANYVSEIHQNGVNPKVLMLGGQRAVPDSLSEKVMSILNGAPIPQKSSVTTVTVPSSNEMPFTPESGSGNTYTIVKKYTFRNIGNDDGSMFVSVYPLYNSATSIQKALSQTITADHDAVITFESDKYGNTLADIKSDNVHTGESLTVTVKATIQVQGYSLAIDGSRLTGKTDDVPSAYLTSESMIESDSQAIKDEAKKLKDSSINLWDLVQKTHQYVYTSMTYDTLMNGPHDNKGALSAITYHMGVCQDFAELEVALLRANGIPARMDIGYGLQDLKYCLPNKDLGSGWLDAKQIGHAWVDIYLAPYGWVPTDPTFAQNDPAYRSVGYMNSNDHLLSQYDSDVLFNMITSLVYSQSETEGIAVGSK